MLFRLAYGGKFEYDLIQTENFEEAWERFLSGYKAINITAPFKTLAYEAADLRSPECDECGACNICVKTPGGIKAYNSDYLAVKAIAARTGAESAAVVGYGGAGRAALAAVSSLGMEVTLFRHAELATSKVRADLVIYTLPREVRGIENIECRNLLEANYKDPCLEGIPGYISGKEWHLMQAVTGYELMSGLKPDVEAMRGAYR